MKNIFKNSKRSIAAILTMCILLSIAGTCVYAAVAEEHTNTVTDGAEQEFIPMMGTRCGNLCDHDDMVYVRTEEKGNKIMALWECHCGYKEWRPVS